MLRIRQCAVVGALVLGGLLVGGGPASAESGNCNYGGPASANAKLPGSNHAFTGAVGPMTINRNNWNIPPGQSRYPSTLNCG